ncbi:hypothetical protein ACCQ05_01965 [Xanthomonas sp. NCPPB 3582]|uniref:hypothetical protein n=1 Tax=Xanthomonas sp. NCPPB 3582 TaxID=487557 RepID=UPI0035561C5D
MMYSPRSTPSPATTPGLSTPRSAANDGLIATVGDAPALADFRCGRTGIGNRDIWCALPDIRSARTLRRLQRWATRGVLFAASGLAFALALASALLH